VVLVVVPLVRRPPLLLLAVGGGVGGHGRGASADVARGEVGVCLAEEVVEA
jgi:hypothetical protein